VYGGTVLHVPLCGVFCLVFADELSLHMLVSEGEESARARSVRVLLAG
jgi:hypothetical protein